VRGWTVLVASALIGCYSHLILDSFTHTWGYGAELLGIANTQLGSLPEGSTASPVYLVDLLQLVGSVVGAAVTVHHLRLIGDRRLLDTSYPDARLLEPTSRSRRILVLTTGVASAIGFASALVPALSGGHHDLLFRSVDSAFVGLVIGSLLARPAMRRPRVAADTDTHTHTAADDDDERAPAVVGLGRG
jgi:hypothetical protein